MKRILVPTLGLLLVVLIFMPRGILGGRGRG